MATAQRVDALRVRHEFLDSKIQRENQRPCPDDLAISELKKEKLRIKDEIIYLQAD